MLTEDAVAAFGSKANIARALNQTTGRITQWGPVVNENSAPKLHVLSNGQVVYDPEFYEALKNDPDYWKKSRPKNQPIPVVPINPPDTSQQKKNRPPKNPKTVNDTSGDAAA